MTGNIHVVLCKCSKSMMENQMRIQIQALRGKDGFPDSPVSASELLIPITSWSEIICESRITGIEFDQFWHDSIKDGVAYFFRWLGNPRATVLVIHHEDTLHHMECRTLGDLLVPQMEAEPIIAEVVKQFQDAGFWRNQSVIGENVYPVETVDDLYHYYNRTALQLQVVEAS